VDLSGLVSSDNQNLTAASLSGTELTISIEDGDPVTVDLADLQNGVNFDEQDLTSAVLSGTELTISIENGASTTVDLAALEGSDNQSISYDATSHIITLEDGGTVDLSGLVSSDNQNLTAASLSGTELTISIEDGDPVTVDLADLQNGVNSDEQDLTSAELSGTELTISIENGASTTVDLADLEGSDNQSISYDATSHIITLEDGGTVDLSDLVSSDNQNLTAASLTGTELTISIEDGNPVTVDLVDLQNGVNSDEQDLTSAVLSGTELTISIENGASTTVDLADLEGSDNQSISYDATSHIITLEDGGTVDLSGLVSSDNQNLTSASLSGTELTISIEDGDPVTVDLADLQNGVNTDAQGVDSFTKDANGKFVISLDNNDSEATLNPISDNKVLVGTIQGTVEKGFDSDQFDISGTDIKLNAETGTDGQVLKIVGGNVEWADNDAMPTLADGNMWIGNAGTATSRAYNTNHFFLNGSSQFSLNNVPYAKVTTGGSSDNGKVLTVKNGIASWESSTTNGDINTGDIKGTGNDGIRSTINIGGTDPYCDVELRVNGNIYMAKDCGVGDISNVRYFTSEYINANENGTTISAAGDRVRIQDALEVYGFIWASGTINTSDERLKSNVNTISNALNTVMKLRGTSYKWKSSNKQDLGVIAQEVEKVLPSLVHTDEKGFKAVSYNGLIPVLIEAIKEQQQIIEGLKSDNASAEAKYEEVKAQNDALLKDIELIKQHLQITSK
ncbi:tail fiber domain-containing protein, partial [Aureibacter tunicatorum]